MDWRLLIPVVALLAISAIVLWGAQYFGPRDS